MSTETSDAKARRADSDIAGGVIELCRRARNASRQLARLTDAQRSGALNRAAAKLRSQSARIVEANAKDLAAGRDAGLSVALLDRLMLSPERIDAMAEGMETVAGLDCPVGGSIESWKAPGNGLDIEQLRIPIGVVGMIYESRPNVTADVAALCVKSGNAVVLKGGKEAIHSNSIIADLVIDELEAASVPRDAVQLIRSTERLATDTLLQQDEYVDILIPRGGPGLVRAVAEKSRIPVIKHYEGICHTYIDRDADLEMAQAIVWNAKVQRPGVCNAMETMLVHTDVAQAFLDRVVARFIAGGVELRGCERTCSIAPGIAAATEADWDAEYLDLILAVRVVDSVDDAIDHINTHGSGHSDAIVTRDDEAAEQFLALVDSATVYRNASTRFTDGFAFGFGAEIGISTNRIHARGPMGLRELTTYKYVVRGEGQIR